MADSEGANPFDRLGDLEEPVGSGSRPSVAKLADLALEAANAGGVVTVEDYMDDDDVGRGFDALMFGPEAMDVPANPSFPSGGGSKKETPSPPAVATSPTRIEETKTAPKSPLPKPLDG